MGKKDAPAPPDYGPLAKVSEKSAEYAYKLGKEQLQWAKQQYQLDSKTVNTFLRKAYAAQDEQTRWAREDRQRYNRVYKPLENEMVRDARTLAADNRMIREQTAPIRQSMIDEAKRYGDPAFMEAEAGRAMADVGQQMDAARRTAITNLESFGINPSATRYAALDMGAGLARAASAAAAGNMQRDNVRAQSRGLQDRAMGIRAGAEGLAQGARSESVNVGRGMPAQALGAYGQATAAGAAGVGARQAQTGLGAQTMGTPMQWQGMGNQAVGMWGDILNTGYNNQLDAWKANQEAAGGVGKLAGGIFGTIFSKMPMLATGGEVPEQASPTEGVNVDDVPAMLTAGEFVIPKDVVEWMGEKTMHGLITKARKEMQAIPEESGATPEFREQPMQEPTFQSDSGIPEEDF